MRQSTTGTTFRVCVTTLVIVGLGGCATKGDLRDVQTDLRGIESRIGSVQELVDRQAQLAEESVDTQGRTIGNFQGEVTSLLREIRDELGRLEAANSANAMAITQLRAQIENLGRSSGTTSRGGTRGGEDPTSIPGAEGSSEDPDEMYLEAMRSWSVLQYSSARYMFEAILEDHPDSDLAPRSLLQLGRIAVEQEEFEEGIARFNELRDRFVEAEEVPEAIFRTALVYIDDLEEEERGKDLLELLIESYPNHTLVDQARRKLGGAS